MRGRTHPLAQRPSRRGIHRDHARSSERSPAPDLVVALPIVVRGAAADEAALASMVPSHAEVAECSCPDYCERDHDVD